MKYDELKNKVTSLIQQAYDLPFANSLAEEKLKNKKKVEYFSKAESLIREYLTNNPNDIEALILLAQLVALLTDDLQAIELLNKVLKIDPGHYKTLLLLAIYEFHAHGSEDNPARTLLEDFSSPDSEVQSMIEIAKSWFYGGDRRINALEKSIKLSDKYVHNYLDLGEYYIGQGDIRKGYEYMKKGVANINPEREFRAEHALSADEYIAEYLLGTQLSIVVRGWALHNFELCKSLLEQQEDV